MADKDESEYRPVISENTVKALGCLVFVVLFLVGGYFILYRPSGENKKTGSRSSEIITLNAAASYTGTQIIITNNDTFDWQNVKMEINGGIIKGGYVLTTPRIEGGGEYSVGVMQFAKSDGSRFNPISTKILKFSIISRTANGMPKGSWYGEFK